MITNVCSLSHCVDTGADIQESWHAVKGQRYPWCGGYPSKLYLFAFRAAVGAHRRWMKGEAGFPKFKTRGYTCAFTVCETIGLRPGFLLLPKLGEVRISAPDSRQADLRRLVRRGRARIKSVTVSCDSAGTWWASLTVERTLVWAAPSSQPHSSQQMIGVDLGVKTLAVAATSDGGMVLHTPARKGLERWERRLRRAQRSVSRKDGQPRQSQRGCPTGTVPVEAAGQGPPPARLQDRSRAHRHRRPVLPVIEDLLGVRSAQQRTNPRRADLDLPELRHQPRPRPQRRSQPRRLGRGPKGRNPSRRPRYAGARQPTQAGTPAEGNTTPTGEPADARTARPAGRHSGNQATPQPGSIRPGRPRTGACRYPTAYPRKATVDVCSLSKGPRPRPPGGGPRGGRPRPRNRIASCPRPGGWPRRRPTCRRGGRPRRQP